MNTFQKRAYRYEVLGDIAERIGYQISERKETIQQYSERINEGDAPEWYQTEVDAANEKIKVLEALKKELEKL